MSPSDLRLCSQVGDSSGSLPTGTSFSSSGKARLRGDSSFPEVRKLQERASRRPRHESAVVVLASAAGSRPGAWLGEESFPSARTAGALLPGLKRRLTGRELFGLRRLFRTTSGSPSVPKQGRERLGPHRASASWGESQLPMVLPIRTILMRCGRVSHRASLTYPPGSPGNDAIPWNRERRSS